MTVPNQVTIIANVQQTVRITKTDAARMLLNFAANAAGIVAQDDDEWFTIGDATYIGHEGNLVSQDPGVAALANAANYLKFGEVLRLFPNRGLTIAGQQQ